MRNLMLSILVVLLSLTVLACGAPKVNISILPGPSTINGELPEKLAVNNARIKYEGGGAKAPTETGDPWPTSPMEYGDDSAVGPGGIIIKVNIFNGTGSDTDADASIPLSLK